MQITIHQAKELMNQERADEIIDTYEAGIHSWFNGGIFIKEEFVKWIWSQEIDVLEFTYKMFQTSDILRPVCDSIRFVILDKQSKLNQN